MRVMRLRVRVASNARLNTCVALLRSARFCCSGQVFVQMLVLLS